MALRFSILLLLSGVTGIHSITTVRKVSVKTGQSISIPCLYKSEETNKVKYLCEGYYWNHCTFVAQTNQAQNSGKFSITDDKTQRIFTVTISRLDDSNGDFWCVSGVEGSYTRVYFSLSVTNGKPSLYTEKQNYAGYTGESITIKFDSKVTGVKKWCRLGGPCVTDGVIDGTTVTIRTYIYGGFTVTMSKLRSESEGWYYCEDEDFQMPVYISVKNKPTTATTTTTVGESETPTSALEKQEKRSSFDLKIVFIPLGLLILTVTTSISMWLILQRRRAKAEASASTEAVSAAEEPTYINWTGK